MIIEPNASANSVIPGSIVGAWASCQETTAIIQQPAAQHDKYCPDARACSKDFQDL